MGLALAIGLNPSDADIKYDWLSASGAVSSDAYVDVRDLADEFGVTIGINRPVASTGPVVHPRTPGAILLALPLLLFDFDHLFAVATFITIASGVAILWPVLATANRNDRVMVSILALICAPTFMTLMFTGQAGLVALLTLFAWPLLFKGRGLAGGLMLAVAGALKIFPLILLVPLLLRRRYFAFGATLAAFVALNIGGLTLPGVSLTGAVDGLSDASTTWVGMGPNGSLVTALFRIGVDALFSQAIAIAVLGFFLTAAVLTRKEKVINDPLPWIISGLLLVPLSWLSYDMILMPALACLLLAKDLRPRLLAYDRMGALGHSDTALRLCLCRPGDAVGCRSGDVARRMVAWLVDLD